MSSLEFGEQRGCGSIVNVYAASKYGERMKVWGEGPDVLCDAPEGMQRMTNQFKVFTPIHLCNTNFRANRVRFEVDTVSVVDFNEFDYVKMTGYKDRPRGVVPFGVTELKYVPDPNFFGTDTFTLRATDCGFFDDGNSEDVQYTMTVSGTIDAPIAGVIDVGYTLNSTTAAISLGKNMGVVYSPDNVDVFISLLSVPR